MKKYLISFLLFVASFTSYSQTVRDYMALHPTLHTPGYLYHDTVIVAPYIANYFLNGNLVFKKFDSTVRLSFSTAGENYLSYANTTGILTANAVNLSGTNVTSTLPESRGGTNQSTYTLGDIIWASATNTLSKLAHGTSGQALRWNGSALVWTDTAAVSGVVGWSVLGNSITAGSNFLGTTNNTSLRFYTNNTSSIWADSLGRLGVTGTVAPTAKFHVISNAIGVTATTANSVLLENQTAATSGNPQWSPALEFGANQWNAVGSASQPIHYRFNVQALSGSNVQGPLYLQFSNNSGAWTNFASFDSKQPQFNLTANINQTAIGANNVLRDPLQLLGATTLRYLYFAGTNGLVIGQDNTTSDLNFRVGTTVTSNTTGNVGITIVDSLGKLSINNPTHTNDYSSVFDVTDTARGIVIPRMTTSQRDSIGLYVSSLTITNGGSGYTGTPSVTFATTSYPFIKATANGTQSGGVINTAPMVTGGFYARTPAAPTVVGGAGTGAVLTPVMTQRLTTGLQIFNTTLNVGQTWDGTRWVSDANLVLGSATLDFGSTLAGAVSDLTVTCTGAADGDVVSIGVPNGSYPATGTFTAWVSAANTVTIRYANNSLTLTQDPASGVFKVKVFKN